MHQCRCNFEKKSCSSHRETSVSCPGKKYNNVTPPYYPFLRYYLSNGGLREVKNKGKSRTFSSESGPVSLQEVLNIAIWLGNFWYFGKLVPEERWSLTRGGRNRRFDCIFPTGCPIQIGTVTLVTTLTGTIQFLENSQSSTVTFLYPLKTERLKDTQLGRLTRW